MQAAGRYFDAQMEGYFPGGGVGVTWSRLPREALADLIGFTASGSPLRELFDELGPQASEAIRKTLIGGLALGQNPREIARQARGALGGNLVRALTISRTETLRAWREAEYQQALANSDILEGWEWLCAKQPRTCPMCLAMDGTVHKLSERLDDHPNGRCTMVPIVKGFPRVARETGGEWLAKQPEDVQRQVLGNAGYEAYRAGAVSLQDFVGQKHSRAWGTTRYARGLREILGATKTQQWRVAARAATQAGQQPSATALALQRAQQIEAELTRLTSTTNNWNGTITVGSLGRNAGVKEWSCSISLDSGMMGKDKTFWPVLNHEMLHALSTGLNPQDYAALSGWEEGVVEKLQRILGPESLKAIGQKRWVGEWAYNTQIAELEALRKFLGKPERDFYLLLLQTSLKDRLALVAQMAVQLQGRRLRRWTTLWQRARGVLG